jgi:hypothetical protein
MAKMDGKVTARIVGQELTMPTKPEENSMPTTEAGRSLLAERSYHWTLCGLNLQEEECTCYLGEWILAIEKEAAEIERKAAVEREIDIFYSKR